MSNISGFNILKLASSKMVVQAVTIITAPIIARLFLPEYFGVRQLFMSLSVNIVIVAGLRYELSIPLGKDKKEAVSSFLLSLIFAFSFSLLSLALIAILGGKIAQWFKSPELEAFLWLLPMAVLLGGLQYSLRYYASREGKFGIIALSDFSLSMGAIIITILWALTIGASATGLFVGYLSGIVIGVLLFVFSLFRKLLIDIRSENINFSALFIVAKKYKKFPIFETWSGLLGTLSSQIPAIIFGLYYSTTIVGYYSLGYRIITLPMSLLGKSISDVFFPSAAKEYNETGTLFNSVSIMYKRLIQLSIFPILVLSFFGASLFGFVFGEKWTEAGVYTQILGGWVLLNTIISPLTTSIIILRRQGLALMTNVAVTLIRVFALLAGAYIGGPRAGLILLVIFNSIAVIFILFWIFHKSGVSILWGLKTLSKYLVLSSILLLPAGCISWLGGNILIVLVSIGLATIIYVCGLFWFEPAFRNFILNNPTIGNLIKRFFAHWNKKDASI